MCDKSKCNCKKFNQADPKDVEELEKKYEEFSKKQSDSLLKKYLTPEVFQKIKARKTRYGSTLLDVIQSGLANLDSGVGAYASDPDSYHVFGPLFEPIIEDYHGGFKPSDKHPASNWGNPKSLPKFDAENEYVMSTRVRCARSLKGFPFNPTMTKDHYCQIQTELSTALESLECDLKGKYYRLADMSEETKTQLINDHFLFKEGDRFLQAARSNEFWPDGRGIFYNETKTLLAWVNEEDHLRLISMQQGSDLQAVYRRLIDALQQLERVVKFDRHPRLGYLTFCPTNLGTTIRASVHIKLPKLGANEKTIKDIAAQYNLQVRGTSGEHTQSEGGIWDISNKRRLGLTEFEALNEMASGIAELIKKEKEAQ